jgi:hypothetical protein
MLLLCILFLAGVLAGLIFEWWYHWLMHDRPLLFHAKHHKEFYRLPQPVVAHNTRDLPALLFQSGLALLIITPLMPFLGVVPVLTVYAGAIWHLLVVYQVVHSLLHDDTVLPGWIRHSRLFKWWKGCHYAHHFHHYHNPTGNFSVTCPLLDWLFGTYLHPRPSYPPLPLESPRHKIVVPKLTILLGFRSAVQPERLQLIIEPIAGWEEVDRTGRLYPGAEGALSRQFYVRLKNGADSQQVIARLQLIPEIEFAEIAADRNLMN